MDCRSSFGRHRRHGGLRCSQLVEVRVTLRKLAAIGLNQKYEDRARRDQGSVSKAMEGDIDQ